MLGSITRASSVCSLTGFLGSTLQVELKHFREMLEEEGTPVLACCPQPFHAEEDVLSTRVLLGMAGLWGVRMVEAIWHCGER